MPFVTLLGLEKKARKPRTAKTTGPAGATGRAPLFDFPRLALRATMDVINQAEGKKMSYQHNGITLRWEVYFAHNIRAACFYPEDAAAMVAVFGNGATIECAGITVWTEGKEKISAAESYDIVAETCYQRIKE
jgi:hypothetical protein